MSLTTISLIHVGDIHHPQSSTTQVLDNKDRGFPKNLANMIATRPLQQSVRDLLRLIEMEKPSVVLFSGDLTDRGELSGYESCVSYLEQAFEIRSPNSPHFLAVPGNHDVDRSLAGDEHDLFAKFTPLADAWKRFSAPILEYREPTPYDVHVRKGKATFFALNSCVGCGVNRYLHEGSTHSESLDTPAFSNDHIQVVDEAIQRSEKDVVPVILAHHNILPQRTPRISPYTETLNAGHVRGRLSGRDRAVIYCHGHTHDDPIEVVQQYTPHSGFLVSVSAPEFSDGFNLIRIYYNSKGRPLGCGIVRHKRTDNVTNPEEEVKISFRRPKDLGQAPPLCKQTFSLIPDPPTRFSDILSAVRAAKPKVTPKQVEQALEELKWYDLIAIHDSQHSRDAWVISRNDT